MSHSHLAIRHLVKQLELSDTRRTTRPALPVWLVQFIDDFSQRFEPFNGVARVGYECQQSEQCWEVALFLGEHEVIGGPQDGQMRPINFRFDLKEIGKSFQTLEGMNWNAFPNSHVCYESMADLSFLTIEGLVSGQKVRVQLHAGPPDSIGPAIRQYPDGRVELV
ncbi:hypothetical protein [Planctomicrobium piriforme]|uniref:hypothetical protein n=1 Tax=Planctomicrobium piriforme TaxID=1576369 RepID=UPI000B876D0B|nr:hypothetical protein [Planctomicrobium piriforme]